MSRQYYRDFWMAELARDYHIHKFVAKDHEYWLQKAMARLYEAEQLLPEVYLQLDAFNIQLECLQTSLVSPPTMDRVYKDFQVLMTRFYQLKEQQALAQQAIINNLHGINLARRLMEFDRKVYRILCGRGNFIY